MKNNYDRYDIGSVRQRLSEMEGKPWLVKESIAFIEEVINKDSIILEFGAGASTIWFAERAKRVYSFETNKAWRQVLHEELVKGGFDNTILYFGVNDYFKKAPSNKGFESMLRGDNIDLALIDHRSYSRSRVFEGTVKVIKANGYLVFDNSNRKRYSQSIEFMDSLGWEKFEFWGNGYSPHGRSWKTTIWKKGTLVSLNVEAEKPHLNRE
ncbi:unnamed protein product [marine sediment metagenome]|uniref:Methyltransferase domain-containing protein n=1 Tax=marine sediment metagenome TaxID=412755 RepID=X1QYR2_9ZZZZ